MPSFRFIRDLIGGRSPEPAAGVRLAELPEWLDRETSAVADRVRSGLEEPSSEVRRAVADLRTVIDRFAKADWDMALHPKLEQVSRTTLPAFVRAMESCLARPFPDDPHEFYATATALLKCGISALRGQGRYLRAVLPNEMSAVKEGVDTIGRAVNRMTAVLGEEKRALDAIEALQRKLDRIAALEAEIDDSSRRAADAREALASTEEERSGVEAGLAALNGSAEAVDLEASRAELARLQARARALEAAHRGQTEGLVTVLKRAERLVARRGDRPTATRLRHLQGLLDAPLSSVEPTLGPALGPALAVVRDLAAAGEISLRENDPVLAAPDSVADAIERRVEEYAGVVDAARTLERTIAAAPVTMERERLAGRLRQLDHRAGVLRDEQAVLARVAGQKANDIAALRSGIAEEVAGVFQGRVSLDPDDA